MYGWHHHGRCYHGGPHSRHHHMPPWMAQAMFGGGKAERGQVRYFILGALIEGEGHGYQIIQTIKERSEGRYQPSPGAIYPTLQMLEEEGMVTSHREGNRTLYTLTDEGRKEYEAHAEEVDDAYEHWSSPWGAGEYNFSRIGSLIKRLAGAVKSAHRRGDVDPKKFDQALDLLEEAVGKVEKLLKR